MMDESGIDTGQKSGKWQEIQKYAECSEKFNSIFVGPTNPLPTKSVLACGEV